MARHLQTTVAVKCMKTLLMVFNIIFWITGIVLLVLGIWMKISLHQFMELSENFSNAVPYTFVATGAAIVLVGFSACCCTVKGQPILLYMLSAFLALVFLLEMGASIAGYVFRDNIESGFLTGLTKSVHNFGKRDVRDQNINSLQSTVGCCGIYNYTDWFDTPWANHSNVVPASCCTNATFCHNQPVSDYSLIYHDGCYQKVVVFMRKNLSAIGGVALGIAFFQLLGVILSCCLAKHINKNKYEQVA